MVDDPKKESQVSTEDSEEAKAAAQKAADEKAKDTKDKLYPENETPEEKETRETKEKEEAAEEEKTAKELTDRAEKVGLKEGATEEEVKAAEDTKAAEEKKAKEEKKTVAELQDEAQKAMEEYQKNPTPENKKLADEAISASKKAVESEKGDKIEYDVKLPEGSLLPEDATEKIVANAREQGFSNEVAQSMVNTASEAVMAQTEQAAKEVDEMVNVTWPKQCSDDKEVGGDDFVANAELSKRVLTKFAPPEFVDLLDPRTKENPNGTSYGNNLYLLKFLVRIGKAMSDDQLILAKGKGPEKKSMAETFYGPKKEKE